MACGSCDHTSASASASTGMRRHRDRWQAITNARPIPKRTHQRDLPQPVPVRVTLHWEHDGTELRDVEAVAWAGRDVLVEVDDPRLRIRWVWLDADDVVRA